MKRAKEYAAELEASPTEGTLEEILLGFWKEVLDLTNSRGVKTDAGAISILEEQHNKWKAFSRLTGLADDGFMRAVEVISPELAEQWKYYRNGNMARRPTGRNQRDR